jgi:hypothetical protein
MKPRKIHWLVGGMMFGTLVSTLALLSGYFMDLEVRSGRFAVKENAAWATLIALSTVTWGMVSVGASSLIPLLQRKTK